MLAGSRPVGLHRLRLGVRTTSDARIRSVRANLLDALDRFDGYADRFSAALDRADQGDGSWVAGIGIDSCHTVWFQLHEDLLATLNIERGRGLGSDGGVGST